MALTQKLVMSALNGKVTVAVEYDDQTLLVTRTILTNSLTRQDGAVCVLKLRNPTNAIIGSDTADSGMASAVSPAVQFMVRDKEDPSVLLPPFQVELNVPHGDDKASIATT